MQIAEVVVELDTVPQIVNITDDFYFITTKSRSLLKRASALGVLTLGVSAIRFRLAGFVCLTYHTFPVGSEKKNCLWIRNTKVCYLTNQSMFSSKPWLKWL